MYKYLLAAILLTGCSGNLKEGECIASRDTGNVYKVDKLEEYGFFAKTINRMPMANICEKGKEDKIYLTYRTFGMMVESHDISRIDCSAYEAFKK